MNAFMFWCIWGASSCQAENERAMSEKFMNVLHERTHVLVHLGGAAYC